MERIRKEKEKENNLIQSSHKKRLERVFYYYVGDERK